MSEVSEKSQLESKKRKEWVMNVYDIDLHSLYISSFRNAIAEFSQFSINKSVTYKPEFSKSKSIDTSKLNSKIRKTIISFNQNESKLNEESKSKEHDPSKSSLIYRTGSKKNEEVDKNKKKIEKNEQLTHQSTIEDQPIKTTGPKIISEKADQSHKDGQNTSKMNDLDEIQMENNITNDSSSYNSEKDSIESSELMERYYTNHNFFCRKCGLHGHSYRFCWEGTDRKCFNCCGSHAKRECNSVVCDRCRLTGHLKRQCDMNNPIKKSDPCPFCHRIGHFKTCRIFGPTNNGFNVSFTGMIKCISCKKFGHYNCSE